MEYPFDRLRARIFAKPSRIVMAVSDIRACRAIGEQERHRNGFRLRARRRGCIMNSLVLVIAAAVAFAFGYRFYSKLLALGVFRPEQDYSTSAPPSPAGEKHATANRHMVFGHHVVSLAAGIAVTGTVVSLIWGWAPAFLWAVVGTVTAAATYGLGALWMATRYPGLDPAQIAARLLGRPAQAILALPIFLLLLLINAICATLAAQTLAGFPSAVLPFWGIALLALFLGNFLYGREDFAMVPATLVALTLSLAGVWLLGGFPLSFTGALHLETADFYISLDATVAWVVIFFVYGYHATRLPMWKLIRPRGYLTGLLLALLLVVFYVAVAIDHPNLVAPEIHAAPGIPRVLPWLFVTLTSGAMAGFHLLIANGVTARQMRRDADARYIGYGGAVALGWLALSAVIIGGTAFTGAPEWNQYYGSWDSLQDLSKALALYVNGFAQYAAGIGLDPGFARTLAATVVTGLLAATLEGGLRAQKHLLAGLAQEYALVLPAREKTRAGIAVALSAILALYDGHGRGGFSLWPIFGIADQVVAVLGFAVLALMLRRLNRPLIAVLIPLVFLLVTTNAALILRLISWWSGGNWILLVLGIILIAMELGLTLLAVRMLKLPPKLDTGP
jgi:carbon starvation protein